MKKDIKASGCIIVLNDELYIERAIQSLKQMPLIDEIVVVDGGSTDRTVAICEQLDCRVVVNPWPNDFSIQRNFAASLCKNDWIVIADSDEWYPKDTCDMLTKMLQNIPDRIAVIKLLEVTDLSSNKDNVPLTIEDINAHYDAVALEQIKSGGKEIRLANDRCAILTYTSRIINKTRGQWVNKIHETFNVSSQFREIYLPAEYLIHHQKTHQRQYLSNARYDVMLHSDCLYSTNYDDFDNNTSAQSVTLLDEIFFKLVTEAAPCDFFIEAGAWDGTMSRMVHNVLPWTEVHAFEANPHNYSEFRSLFKDTQINYINMAISNQTGELTFHVHTNVNGIDLPRIKGNDSLLLRTESNVTYEQVTVPSTTLNDYFVDRIQNVNSVALWIDLEGAAHQALEGASELLTKTKIIKIEVESYQFWKNQKLDRDICLFLAQHGFLAVLRDYEYPQQYNILFAKQEIIDSPAFLELVKPYNLTKRTLG